MFSIKKALASATRITKTKPDKKGKAGKYTVQVYKGKGRDGRDIITLGSTGSRYGNNRGKAEV